mgnify:CR=1 FL=1
MKRLSRRMVLRGLGGVAVGLPLLESLLPKRAWAQAATAPKRVVVFFQCNGANMQKFFPVTPYGALSAASLQGTSLQPLTPYVQKLLIPRGMHKVPKGFNLGGQTPVGCDHQNGMGGKLTAQALSGTDHYANGISMDQALARAVNPSARPPLTLKVGPRGSGVLSIISYRGAQQPVPGENNPWFAFRDFMGLGTPPPPPPPPPMTVDAGTSQPPPPPPPMKTAEQRLLEKRLSVLDLVKEDMAELKVARLSKSDREKLDMHLTAIRDVEKQMVSQGLPQQPPPDAGSPMMAVPDAGSPMQSPSWAARQCSLDAAKTAELQAINPNTISSDAEYKKMGQLQMDVLAIALACDWTRVATLQWGNGSQGPIFNWDGMTNQYNHHKLSHGNTADDNSGSGISDYLDRLLAIDTWYAQQLSYLLGRLSGYAEDGASLLDNTTVAWVNELSDGKAHDFRDMPIVLAGGGHYFKQGQYVKVTSQANTLQSVDAPHNKLLTMLMNSAGANVTNFGAYGEPGEFAQLKR